MSLFAGFAPADKPEIAGAGLLSNGVSWWSKAKVGARRVLLVTSALHIPGALAVFQAVFAGSGVTVVPAATDAEALGDEPELRTAWLPDARSLEWSSRSVKEYLGLAQVWMATN